MQPHLAPLRCKLFVLWFRDGYRPRVRGDPPQACQTREGRAALRRQLATGLSAGPSAPVVRSSGMRARPLPRGAQTPTVVLRSSLCDTPHTDLP